MNYLGVIRTSLCMLVAAVCLAPVADAATFRVTTKIYAGANPTPAAEHLVLFDEGLIYDLPQEETRIVTVFDAARKQVTLLDRRVQLQTTISTDDLLRVAAQARAEARTPEQKTRLGLNATVQSSKRVIGYAIEFGSLEYNATTQGPEDPAIAAEYAQFAVLASQLNIVRRLGPPPFARLTLCRYIADQGEVPLEWMLTVGRGANSREYRATHAFTQLSDTDRDRIQEVRGMLGLYREVGWTKFPQAVAP